MKKVAQEPRSVVKNNVEAENGQLLEETPLFEAQLLSKGLQVVRIGAYNSIRILLVTVLDSRPFIEPHVGAIATARSWASCSLEIRSRTRLKSLPILVRPRSNKDVDMSRLRRASSRIAVRTPQDGSLLHAFTKGVWVVAKARAILWPAAISCWGASKCGSDVTCGERRFSPKLEDVGLQHGAF